jgi:hypothetical protein
MTQLAQVPTERLRALGRIGPATKRSRARTRRLIQKRARLLRMRINLLQQFQQLSNEARIKLQAAYGQRSDPG